MEMTPTPMLASLLKTSGNRCEQNLFFICCLNYIQFFCCLIRSKNLKTRVIGCPKTIDGDLKCKEVPTSFGFDTACKVSFSFDQLLSGPSSVIT